MMGKSKAQGYISESAQAFVETFSPGETGSGRVSFLLEWCASVLRAGAVQAVNDLDADERKAVIASLNTYVPDPRVRNLAAQTAEWFKLGGGLMWDWPEEKIGTLTDKLSKFDPAQTMGLILWGKAFWSTGNDNLEGYAANFARLIEK
jgi:hypothetical protein